VDSGPGLWLKYLFSEGEGSGEEREERREEEDREVGVRVSRKDMLGVV